MNIARDNRARPFRSDLTGIARDAVWGCAGLMLALLLLQPLLCTLNCVVHSGHRHVAAAAAPGAAEQRSAFICDVPPVETVELAFVPAFWPGLTLLVLLLLAGAGLPTWLASTAPTPLTGRRWAPLPPPPRRAGA
jgi:hypothetical protein